MIPISRRRFNTLLAGTGLAATLPALPSLAKPSVPGDQSKTFLRWERLGKGAWVGMGAGGNCLVSHSDGAALLVDTKNGGFGPLLRREAEMLGRPVRVVINTHHHADHTGGNSAFTEDLRVIGQRRSVDRVEAQFDRYRQQAEGAVRELAGSDAPGAETGAIVARAMLEDWDALRGDFAPNVTLDTELFIDDHGLNVQARHRGAGHTDNDVYVFLPDQNILHCGDLLFYRNHPYIDLGAGADIDGWMASCRKMIELCDSGTTVVPGHGEICDVNGIREQIDYFETMRRIVKHAKHVEGMGKEQVQKMTPSQFSEFGFERLQAMNLGLVWDQV